MTDMVAETEARVEMNTEQEINERIHRELEARVYYYAQRPSEIDNRLDELDQEWDIERVLETNAGVLSLLGLTLGALRGRWYILPGLAGAFLIQHAVEGWCPPVSVLRRLGIRTTREINHERFALKALRGDFAGVYGDGQQTPDE
ncbi:MAG: YgaP-like transmembrane domain, partial [Solirubrobacterales bacterium]